MRIRVKLPFHTLWMYTRGLHPPAPAAARTPRSPAQWLPPPSPPQGRPQGLPPGGWGCRLAGLHGMEQQREKVCRGQACARERPGPLTAAASQLCKGPRLLSITPTHCGSSPQLTPPTPSHPLVAHLQTQSPQPRWTALWRWRCSAGGCCSAAAAPCRCRWPPAHVCGCMRMHARCLQAQSRKGGSIQGAGEGQDVVRRSM